MHFFCSGERVTIVPAMPLMSVKCGETGLEGEVTDERRVNYRTMMILGDGGGLVMGPRVINVQGREREGCLRCYHLTLEPWLICGPGKITKIGIFTPELRLVGGWPMWIDLQVGESFDLSLTAVLNGRRNGTCGVIGDRRSSRRAVV